MTISNCDNITVTLILLLVTVDTQSIFCHTVSIHTCKQDAGVVKFGCSALTSLSEAHGNSINLAILYLTSELVNQSHVHVCVYMYTCMLVNWSLRRSN